MFKNAEAFNEDISGWNVSNGTDFSGMFQNAHAFRQDLTPWNVSSASGNYLAFLEIFNYAEGGFYPSGISYSTEYFLGQTITGDESDQILIGTFYNDVLIGLGGDDLLNGGSGDDQLTGGSGNAIFQ